MRVLGHPVHPILIVFPVALFVTATGFDLVAAATGDEAWYGFSYWLIAAGVVLGLVAAVFGFLDWRELPSGSRARRIGTVHGLGNVVVVSLFAASWWLRGEAGGTATHEAFMLSLLGTGLLFVTGWLGGELVTRLGVGVDRGAHYNAPSSLTDSGPAGPRLTPTPGE